jgi:F-type H+-transporting ATPase subunit b
VDILAAVGGQAADVLTLAAEEGSEGGGLVINLFWVIVASVNFLLLLALLWAFGFGPVSRTLHARRERIARGLADAEQARRDRESAELERQAALAEARREANDILARAQKVATESREADMAAARAEIERLRERATADIEAERSRAISDLRAEVADLALAAASKVVGESMTDERNRRLVEDFLAQPPSGAERN